MTPFDLLFIALVLTTVGVALSCLVSILRGRGDRARRRFARWGLGALVYMGVVVAVGLITPRRVVSMGDEQCSDDWCIAVQDAARTTDSTIAVTFWVSSRALRVTQRERYVVAYLRDGNGRRYDPEPAAGEPPFDVALGPGVSVSTRRTFRVPPGAARLGVIITREGDIPFPRCCIIGAGPFHKDPVVPLP